LWLEFKLAFKDQFFLVNAVAEVMNKLEETAYYQGSQTVEDYLDEFQTLIVEASYINSPTIVVKFCYGLRDIIQNQIKTLLIGYPKNTDLLVWFEATKYIG